MFRLLAIAVLVPVALAASSWSEKQLRELSNEELAYQLLVVPAHGSGSDADLPAWIEAHPVGGLIFMGGNGRVQRELVERCQEASRLPLLVAQDQEWGPAMRLSDGLRVPKALTLGAITDPKLLEPVGHLMGRAARSVGVNWTLGPVADLLVDPELRVVGQRSFGSDPEAVAARVSALVHGLQSADVLACAKHFPGHGAANADSHFQLPQLPDDPELCLQALTPFAAAIDSGVDTIMVGHMEAPVWESEARRPTSLSSAVMRGLLRVEMGFEGLIVTDSFHMQAILADWPLEVAVPEALAHGADMVLMGASDEAVNREIRAAVPELVQAICRRLSRHELEEHARHVLAAKQRLNLHHDRSIGPAIDPVEASRLVQQLYNQAITLVRDEAGLIPLGADQGDGYTYLQVGGKGETTLLRELTPYIWEQGTEGRVILAVFPEQGLDPQRFGVSRVAENVVQTMGDQCIVVWFGQPFGLRYFRGAATCLVAYEPTEEAQRAAASLLLGRIPPRGKLPVGPATR